MDDKIAFVIKKITDNYLQRIEDLLSFCESPIEKLMLICLYHYCDSFATELGRSYHNVQLLEEKIAYGDLLYHPALSISEFDCKRLNERVKRFNFRYNDNEQAFYKISGFKVEKAQREGMQVNDIISGKAKSIKWRLEVYPQYEIVMDNTIYRVDIAIILKRLLIEPPLGEFSETFSQTVIETRRIAIECDGHNFHSSKEQKKKDDVRTRRLMSIGWKVMRYSGSELNSIISDYKNQFPKIFDEIVKVFEH